MTRHQHEVCRKIAERAGEHQAVIAEAIEAIRARYDATNMRKRASRELIDFLERRHDAIFTETVDKIAAIARGELDVNEAIM